MRHLLACEVLWGAVAAAVDAPPMAIVCRIAAALTARIARRRSQGPAYGLMVNAVAVEAYHRRPEVMAPDVAAQRLAQQLALEAVRHLLPLRMRPRASGQ